MIVTGARPAEDPFEDQDQQDGKKQRLQNVDAGFPGSVENQAEAGRRKPNHTAVSQGADPRENPVPKPAAKSVLNTKENPVIGCPPSRQHVIPPNRECAWLPRRGMKLNFIVTIFLCVCKGTGAVRV